MTPLAALRVLITSGPTREPVDEVRFLSNVSTGRLGVSLARAFLAADAEVVLLVGEGALAPDDHPRLRRERFGSAARLRDALLRETAPDSAGGPVDVLIHAAAVADYAPVPVAGKISSSAPALTLELRPTPKVADAVRAARPTLPILLFKLEAGIDRDELHARARRTMARVGAQGVVANLLSEVGEDRHRADLLRADGTAVALADREALAAALVAEAAALAAARRSGGAR